MGIPSPPAQPRMLSARLADDLVVWAPAKVNLFLEVLAKRADGYHEIATLMLAVGLYDTLVLKADASGTIGLRVSQASSGRAASVSDRRTGKSPRMEELTT